MPQPNVQIEEAPVASTATILAFDASCGVCSAVSRRVAQACSGKVATLPLTHPDVVRWRERATPEAALVPTLIQIDARGLLEERVKAWTGIAIVTPLIRHLGVRDAIKVTRALGQMRQEATDEASVRSRPRGLSRRSLFQVGAGAVVAAGILSGASSPATARTPGVRNTELVRAAEVEESLPRVLGNADVVNVTPTANLNKMTEAARPAGIRADAAGLRMTINEGDTPGAVWQSQSQIDGGVQMTTSALVLDDGKVIVLEEYTPSLDGIFSNAYRVRLEGTSAHFEQYSTNGSPDTTVGGELQTRADSAAPCTGYPKDDPCGGCCLTGGTGAVLVNRCRSADVIDCALAAGACAACSTSCTGGAACFPCLVTACGATIKTCCDKVTTSCSSSACSA